MSRPQVIDDEEHERVHDRVAAVDMAKDAGVVCTRTPHPSRPGARRSTVRTVRARMKTIRTLGRQLKKDGIEVVALESTGARVLVAGLSCAGAGRIEVCVCNAAHMRNVPGRKRDITDCQWIAELHEYGLLRASFIPAAEVAARGSGRGTARSSSGSGPARASGWPRCWRTPASRPASVASQLPGVSGRGMIEALIAGERNPGRLADLAKGVLRRKTDELQMACDGRFTRSHAQMCRLHLDAYDHLTGQIAELDAPVAEAAAPFGRLIARLVTIPGIGRRTGEVIIAETGGDMARFATPARLAAPDPQGRPAPAHRHGRVRLGHLAHRHPSRRPVPPSGPAVRPACGCGARADPRPRSRPAAVPSRHDRFTWPAGRTDAPPPAASVARLNNGLIAKPPRRSGALALSPV